MDVWTTLILLAALVVLFTKATAFVTRRRHVNLMRRFTDFDHRTDAGLRGDRSGTVAHFPRGPRTAH